MRMVLIWLILLSTSVLAQLSPGDLAESHESLEGLTNCTECHELGEGPSAKKCLSCHLAIKRAMNSGRGYHYRITTLNEQLCMVCHSDHAGKDFDLIKWPGGQNGFDHAQTGYELEGAHAKVTCRDCHNPANLPDEFSSYDRATDITRTFLGLQAMCGSCHIDEHRGQLKKDCTNCHKSDRFKGAARFDHASARFKLTGKHQKVDCVKCHAVISGPEVIIRNDSSYVKYVDISFDRCDNCHKDKHEGKYVKGCDQCHKTSGFKNIIRGGFDHSQTKYPLLGRHSSVACEKCHNTPSLLDKIKHDLCRDCHFDNHMGQFAKREDKGKCEGCHNQNGFTPALYTTGDHKLGRFELKGAHLALPCMLCHTIDSTLWERPARRYTLDHENCTDCHADIHLEQFTASDPVKLCTTCHTEQLWQLADFDHKSNTNYSLKGAHKKIRCQACHKRIAGDPEYTLYRSTGTNCIDCHVNPEKLPDLVGEDS